MKARIAALAILMAASAPAAAQPEPPELQLTPPALRVGMENAEIATALDAWLGGLQAEGVFNGVVLVARDGREVFARAYGARALEPEAPLEAESRLSIASIGKVLTHIAVAQLVQSGRLSMEATIADILPEYPNSVSRTATIAQLLQHRAGLADIFGPDFMALPNAQFASNHDYYNFVSRQPPMFAPGASEEYCNGCYVVLGEIIARVTGQSYEEYVAAHVLAPAGMSRSGFFRHDRLPADAASFIGQPRGPGTPFVNVSRFHGVAGSAAGGVYASARDLLALDNALREHRLINSAFTAQVLRGQPEEGRARSRVGYAGGGPGVNAVLIGNGAWTLIVLANRPEPVAEVIGQTVFPLLAGPRGP